MKKAAVAEMMDYMIAEDLLWDDDGILWFGRKGEKSFGYRNFMEILSPVTEEPLFTVRCWNENLGVVPPDLFSNLGGLACLRRLEQAFQIPRTLYDPDNFNAVSDDSV